MGTYSYTGTAQFVHVSETGVYNIVAYGASGGNNTTIPQFHPPFYGGAGGITGGDFNLTAGETLEIVVGGEGQNGPYGGGGGGGTFVLGKASGASYALLLAAGGGGGASYASAGGVGDGGPGSAYGFGGAGGSSTSNGPGNGDGGGGGAGFQTTMASGPGGGGGGGGGGAFGSGAAGEPQSYSGGTGGVGGSNYAGAGGSGSAAGGFGGGGGAGSGPRGGGGGGGGYSGGDGGDFIGPRTAYGASGGSFFDAPAISDQTVTNRLFEQGNGFVVITPSVTCFVSGTKIRTTRGDVAVEDLEIGELVVTASGALRPIRWLGHRRTNCRRFADPTMAWPVRIAAHAFGTSKPARDLLVSPGHAICVNVLGDVLIPAGALIDGSTVTQEEVDEVTYWHVELDSHDMLVAENLAAESYLDMGNRGFFQEASVVDLTTGPDRIDAATRTHADFCRPFRADGPVVDAVRAQMRARARIERGRLPVAA